MKILTFITFFPNAARPSYGIFVETRLRHIMAIGQVASRVVVPVPWFPSRNAWFGDYAAHASAPHEARRHGIHVLHPRDPVLPTIGMTLAPILLTQSVEPVIERVLAQYRFDLINAHYFHPDGVAAILLGRHFGKPVVITARGTDTVARELKDKLVGLLRLHEELGDSSRSRCIMSTCWSGASASPRTTVSTPGACSSSCGSDRRCRSLTGQFAQHAIRDSR